MKKVLPPLVILLLAAAVWTRGAGGVFLLDDFANLKTLDRLSSPLTFEALSSFLFTNPSGLFGRLLPMASFALQYASWPNDAASFRLVNIAIHLGNGVLVWLLMRRLLRLPAVLGSGTPALSDQAAERMALAISAAWLLEPLQVSTVLYVVQRMAELSASFTLAGLLLYLHGRKMALARPGRGYGLMCLGVVGMTLLAALSKENGVLLPLFILLMEFTLLGREPAPAGHRIFMWVVFAPPLVAGIGYFAPLIQGWLQAGYATRDFTLGERLLTQARVLVDYLRLAVLPPVTGFGVFHDDFKLSRSLFDPVSTFWCMALLMGLAGIALAYRKRAPLLAFAILWFFVAHSMESTVLPLEIYFEHRNYLAILGPVLLLCMAGRALLVHPAAKGLRYFFAALCALWFSYISFVTWQECKLWAQRPWFIAELWGRDHPHSLRAQTYLADALAAEGFTSKAASLYQTLAEGEHHSASAYLNWLGLGCRSAQIAVPDLGRMEQALRQAHYLPAIVNGFESLVILKENRACIIADADLLRMFAAVLANPRFREHQFSLYVLQGRLLSTTGQTDVAILSFARAYALRHDVEVALLQVKALAEAGRFDEATAKLALATEANAVSGLAQRGYATDIENWRIALEKSRLRHY